MSREAVLEDRRKNLQTSPGICLLSPSDSEAVRRFPVFFYGLYMDSEVLRSKGINPAGMRFAIVDGFALHIGERATLWPSARHKAYGMVLELLPPEIELLYVNLRNYRAEPVLAQFSDASIVAAFCFNLACLTPSKPNPTYVSEWKALAEKLSLPQEYVLATLEEANSNC